ncbi:MAG: isoprenylcysteine carboxylmethyltransferase family protein [Myxococcales bacterium]|nr:isoprenylcysteine carboxylmethyltransferase family protein [Myxococcales bacterium]
MRRSWLVSTIIFLVGVVVLVPVSLLLLFRHTPHAADPAPFHSPFLWAALVACSLGIFLGFWSLALFLQLSRGTPSFWAPAKKLIIVGPYQHLRNPMIVGLLLVLYAEALFFRSLPLSIWAAANTLFYVLSIPLFEEPALEARFREGYIDYKQHVPRWFPRFRAWNPPSRSKAPTLVIPHLGGFRSQPGAFDANRPSPVRSLAPTESQPFLSNEALQEQASQTPASMPNFPRFRAHVPNCPLIHLWRDIISQGRPSELWFTRCTPTPEEDPMQFAWDHALYGEHMLMLLSRLEHPQKEALQRQFWWFFREYEVEKRGQMPAEGDNVSPLIRKIVPIPPSLEETIQAFRTPPPRCPIAEFLAELQFRPEAIPLWVEAWGEHGDPLQAAWNAARSAQAMSNLLEHFYNPRYATKIRAKLITRLGGSLEGFTEEECSNALKEVEPYPPRFEDVMNRAEELRESMLDPLG